MSEFKQPPMNDEMIKMVIKYQREHRLNLYLPCPCESGKKFKFCCFKTP